MYSLLEGELEVKVDPCTELYTGYGRCPSMCDCKIGSLRWYADRISNT